MLFGKLLNPGLWLMRRMRFAGKFAWLSVLSALPLLAMLLPLMLMADPAAARLGTAVWCGGVALAPMAYFLLALYRSLAEDLGQVIVATDRMVAGDLRLSLVVRGADELGSLATSMGQLGRTLSGMVANVRSNAAFVAHSGKSLSMGNRDLSDRTEQQAANLEQTAASVEQLSSTVQDNAHTASQANAQAAGVRDVADRGPLPWRAPSSRSKPSRAVPNAWTKLLA